MRAATQQSQRASGRVSRALTAGLMSIVLIASCSDDDAAVDAAPDEAVVADSTAGDPTAESDTGDIHTTEPTRSATPESPHPVTIDTPAEFGNGVVAVVTSVAATEVVAILPGETSGPGLALNIDITNGSPDDIALDNVTVDLLTGDLVSASQITTGDHRPFAGTLAAGETTTGTYVFTVSPDSRESATLTIRYTADQPAVIFTGDLSDA